MFEHNKRFSQHTMSSIGSKGIEGTFYHILSGKHKFVGYTLVRSHPTKHRGPWTW